MGSSGKRRVHGGTQQANMLQKTLLLCTLAVAYVTANSLVSTIADKTIVDLAVATPDLSTLVTPLKAGGLVDTLSGKGPFTVFAPTNEAFAKLPAATLAHLLKPANVKELDAVLTYHVVAGVAAFSKDLTDGEKIKTVEGQDVTASIFKPGRHRHRSNRIFINKALVTTADVSASNGVIHIIDKVLSLPPAPAPAPVPTKNIVELASSVADLSTLVTALVAGKLTTALSGKGPFTVFAPTNEAFAALPKATLAHLLEPENIKELQLVLEYHVIPGAAIHAADLKSFQTAKTLEGQAVTIVKHNGDILVDKSKVITADVDATNGVVHIIDAVLIPPKAPPAPCSTRLFNEDAQSKHCYEACAEKAFSMKHFRSGKCPDEFSTSDSAEIVVVCPDGTTNIKYCPVTWIKVAVSKKGLGANALVPAPVENITWSYALPFCDPSFKGAGTLHKALAPGANEVFATLSIANHTGRTTYCPFAFNLSCLLHADGITLQSRYKVFNQSGYPDGFINGPNVTSGCSKLFYGTYDNSLSCCFEKT